MFMKKLMSLVMIASVLVGCSNNVETMKDIQEKKGMDYEGQQKSGKFHFCFRWRHGGILAQNQKAEGQSYQINRSEGKSPQNQRIVQRCRGNGFQDRAAKQLGQDHHRNQSEKGRTQSKQIRVLLFTVCHRISPLQSLTAQAVLPVERDCDRNG